MSKYKLKGAYWHPDPLDYANSISTASPPCWHKDLGNIVSIRAANAAMIDGVSPEQFIRSHTDPFDFMCRIRVNKDVKLYWGDDPIQRTTRYYVSTDGRPLSKISPPPEGCEIGSFKRAPKISKFEYQKVMAETGGAWDARVCTKNQSRYDDSRTMIQAGWVVQECNDMSSFRFDNINYKFYIDEAMKLII